MLRMPNQNFSFGGIYVTAIRPIADYIAAFATLRNELDAEITTVKRRIVELKTCSGEPKFDEGELKRAVVYEHGLKKARYLLSRHLRRLGID